MSIWLRVGGYPATEIAAHTPPTWETWADGGTGSISWAFSLSMRSQHQALRPDALVQVMVGPVAVATGLMGDPDRTTWECVAHGLAADAKNYLALDGGGNVTRNLATAITQAQVAGWRASNPADIAGTVAGDLDGSPITLATLLDQRAEELGRRWGVSGRRALYVREDPTVPTWLAAPDAAAFGTTSEGQVGMVKGRYLDSGTSTYQTVTVGSGKPQVADDLTAQGAMTAAQASAILSGMATRRRGRHWINGVNLTGDQLQTMGGTPAFLASVRAGQMMRSFGLANEAEGLALDTVIGKTRYTAGEKTIYVEPVNTAPRTAAAVWAKQIATSPRASVRR